MFTGIIESKGETASVKRIRNINELGIRHPDISSTSSLGDSIAINGVCLTISKMETGIMYFEVSEETRRNTNIDELSAGSPVNLERAMGHDSRFGGHIVTGHVDGVGEIVSKTQTGGAVTYEIKAPDSVMKYLVKKGSIAVDGISLTVAELSEEGFSLVIIPHTLLITTLAVKGKGDRVNLEADIIGKYVEKFVSIYSNGAKKNNDMQLLNKLRDGGYFK